MTLIIAVCAAVGFVVVGSLLAFYFIWMRNPNKTRQSAGDIALAQYPSWRLRGMSESTCSSLSNSSTNPLLNDRHTSFRCKRYNSNLSQVLPMYLHAWKSVMCLCVRFLLCKRYHLCCVVQGRAVQCSAVQCSAVQCSAVQC